MPTIEEMTKHLGEARDFLDPTVRNKMKHDSYLGELSDIAILEKGLKLAQKYYPMFLEIRPIEAERYFNTLISDLTKEINKLKPKPKPKPEKPKEEPKEKEEIKPEGKTFKPKYEPSKAIFKPRMKKKRVIK